MKITALTTTGLALTASFASVANASDETCGSLEGCYLRDLETGMETKLSMDYMVTFDYIPNKSRHSIRCEVDGSIDQMEFGFMPDGEMHRTWSAPFWIDGSSDNGWVEPSDWLQSCGMKELTVEGITWKKDCFKASFKLMAKCYDVCKYDLEPGNENSQGTASVVVGPNSVAIDFKGAKPDTVYTIWSDFINRGTGKIASDYPAADSDVDISKSGPGIGRGVAPLFGKAAPVFEGMGLDLNSVLTDKNGNGKFFVKLDYNLLKAGDTPVVAESLSLQGGNRIGGSWLRMYEKDISEGPSAQILDANHHPVIVSATAQGLTIVGHFQKLTHGHTPGVGGVDHFPGFKGDFPASCTV